MCETAFRNEKNIQTKGYIVKKNQKRYNRIQYKTYS